WKFLPTTNHQYRITIRWQNSWAFHRRVVFHSAMNQKLAGSTTNSTKSMARTLNGRQTGIAGATKTTSNAAPTCTTIPGRSTTTRRPSLTIAEKDNLAIVAHQMSNVNTDRGDAADVVAEEEVAVAIGRAKGAAVATVTAMKIVNGDPTTISDPAATTS